MGIKPSTFDDETFDVFLSFSHDDHISREEMTVMLRDCLCLKVPNEDGEESIKVLKNLIQIKHIVLHEIC